MPINWILGHKPQQTIAKFIRKVYYLDSLANVIRVKKANGKWRMCVDFSRFSHTHFGHLSHIFPSYSIFWGLCPKKSNLLACHK